MDKTAYHIYAKEQCIYSNLNKEKFEETWDMLHKMVELLDTDLRVGDLRYEKKIY